MFCELLSAVTILAVQGSMQPLKVMLNMGLGTNSHIKPLLEMGTVLRERNHEVVYAAFDADEKHNERYNFRFASLGKWKGVKEGEPARRISRGSVDPYKNLPKLFKEVSPGIYDVTYLRLSEVVDKERPDVIVCDFFSSACRDLAQMKGIPLITGFQTTDIFGITEASSLTSNMDYGSITTNGLSFFERFQEKVVEPLKQHIQYYPVTKAMNKVRAKYGVPPASTPFGDYSTSLGLANTFLGLEAAVAVPPHIKMVGPIKADSHSPLTSDLKMFLANHPKTMYIAFGSNAVFNGHELNNLILGSLNAISEGTIDGVIWGLGKTRPCEFPRTYEVNGTEIQREKLFSNQHHHVRLLSWAPQAAILEHENTRLFLSHGGLESSFEAIMSGTPILCMPLMGDQPRNAKKLEDAGIGSYVNRATVTPSSLATDVQTMLDDDTGSIAINVKRMQTLAHFGSRRKEIGADAIEEYAYTAKACRPLYPLKYGEISCELKHLTLVDREDSYLKAKLIDVYAAALLLITLSLWFSVFLTWSFISHLYANPSIHTYKKNN
ncbi:hypothetical protein DSO57_1008600 [Entomophthora muscae]|uniref:Uncharacterized protein n=1 Tax=Entomophthora muscae TaxID=34485 RepID=A0ACC2S8Y6_9FUNG|nr:hypothetical protein DSO57_1008600 [Entomophthora muscae]